MSTLCACMRACVCLCKLVYQLSLKESVCVQSPVHVHVSVCACVHMMHAH